LKIVSVLFLGLFLSLASFSALAKNIVVTIAPLASAIKPLLSSSDKLTVLLGNNQSAHHFSLKPSQLLAINRADLVISIGLGIDDWATKAIKNSKAQHIVFSSLEGMLIREVTTGSHNDQHHNDFDPHLWLDLSNIQIFVKKMTKILSVPNKQQWLNRLAKTDKIITNKLAKYKNTPFIVQHAGFQYFEKKHSLNNLGSIQTNDAGAGLQKIVKLRKRIEKQNVRCIFKSPHGSKKQITALIAELKHKVRVVEINAMGDKNLDTVQVMEQLMANYKQCLDD